MTQSDRNDPSTRVRTWADVGPFQLRDDRLRLGIYVGPGSHANQGCDTFCGTLTPCPPRDFFLDSL